MRFFTVLLFTLMGWKQHGQMPAGVTKCVVLAAPHTSNFDFILAMAGFYKMNMPIRYLLKKDWVDFFLLKRIFKNSGALGVDRSKNTTMVDSLAELIRSSKEDMAIMISPEGTRKLVHKWKTGFYYAALKANVPVVLSHLDYAKKIAAIGPCFMPTGNYKKDMQIVKDYYKDITPKFPENFSLQIYEDDENELCTG